jgi:hypothetical protein
MVKKTVEIETRVTGENQAKSKLGSLANFIKSRFVVTLGDIVRVGKSVVNYFIQVSKRAQEQELVTKKLNQALINQNLFTKATSESLSKQANAFERLSKFESEQIGTLQTLLISYGVMPSKIKEVTQVTMDLASGLGMDLENAGQLVAKTLGSTTNAFARFGIEVNGNVGSTERLTSLIDGMSSKFGGQAKADTETLSGATNILNKSWEELNETILTSNNDVITPYINSLSKLIQKTNDLISQNKMRGDALKLASKGEWSKMTNEQAMFVQEYYSGIASEVAKGLPALEEELAKAGTGTGEVIAGNANMVIEGTRTKEEIQKQINEIKKELNIFTGFANKAKAIIDKKGKEGTKPKTAEELAEEAKLREEARKKELEAHIKHIERKYNKTLEVRDLTKEEEIAQLEEQLALTMLNEDERNALIIEKRKLLGEKKLEAETKIEEESQKMKDMFGNLEIIGTAIKSKELVEIAKALAVSKATIDAYTSFNTTLASLPYPLNVLPAMQSLATGLATVATIASTPVTFAQGGQFETNQATNFNTTSGQTAQVGEKGLERITVEPIGKSQSSGGTMNVTINLGGQELKKVAIALSPYMNAVNKGVI